MAYVLTKLIGVQAVELGVNGEAGPLRGIFDVEPLNIGSLMRDMEAIAVFSEPDPLTGQRVVEEVSLVVTADRWGILVINGENPAFLTERGRLQMASQTVMGLGLWKGENGAAQAEIPYRDPNTGQETTIQTTLAFVAGGSEYGVQIMGMQDRASPAPFNVIPNVDAQGRKIFDYAVECTVDAKRKLLYVSDWYEGIKVIDISDPFKTFTADDIVMVINTTAAQDGVVIDNDTGLVYIADANVGVQAAKIGLPRVEFTKDEDGDGLYEPQESVDIVFANAENTGNLPRVVAVHPGGEGPTLDATLRILNKRGIPRFELLTTLIRQSSDKQDPKFNVYLSEPVAIVSPGTDAPFGALELPVGAFVQAISTGSTYLTPAEALASAKTLPVGRVDFEPATPSLSAYEGDGVLDEIVVIHDSVIKDILDERGGIEDVEQAFFKFRSVASGYTFAPEAVIRGLNESDSVIDERTVPVSTLTGLSSKKLLAYSGSLTEDEILEFESLFNVILIDPESCEDISKLKILQDALAVEINVVSAISGGVSLLPRGVIEEDPDNMPSTYDATINGKEKAYKYYEISAGNETTPPAMPQVSFKTCTANVNLAEVTINATLSYTERAPRINASGNSRRRCDRISTTVKMNGEAVSELSVFSSLQTLPTTDTITCTQVNRNGILLEISDDGNGIWNINWNNNFMGGNLIIEMRKGDIVLSRYSLEILGRNPSYQDVIAYANSFVSEISVICGIDDVGEFDLRTTGHKENDLKEVLRNVFAGTLCRESTSTPNSTTANHFNVTGNVYYRNCNTQGTTYDFPPVFQAGRPLLASDGGYGMGQLTNPGFSVDWEMIWNWQVHTKAVIRALAGKLSNSINGFNLNYVNSGYQFTPEIDHLMADTLTRYNGKTYYNVEDPRIEANSARVVRRIIVCENEPKELDALYYLDTVLVSEADMDYLLDLDPTSATTDEIKCRLATAQPVMCENCDSGVFPDENGNCFRETVECVNQDFVCNGIMPNEETGECPEGLKLGNCTTNPPFVYCPDGQCIEGVSLACGNNGIWCDDGSITFKTHEKGHGLCHVHNNCFPSVPIFDVEIIKEVPSDVATP